VFNEKDSHEGPIRFLAMFQHAVQPPMDVEPTERSFHLPSLAAIPPVVEIFGWATARDGNMVLAIGGNGNNAAVAQGLAVRFTVVAFVQAQAFGFAFTLADANAINRLQQFDKVVAVGFTQGEVEGMPVGVNDQMAFQPFNPVFSGVPDLGIRPFFDLTTLASW
jgi:hypothetical protein